MSLRERIIENLHKRRDTVINGKVNCIPLPFKRFKNEFPGIERGTYYLVSGPTKSAKTQITNYLFVYNTVLYMYYYPGVIEAKISYYPLEETPEAITLRFMSFLLNHLYKVRLSPTDLKSTNNEKPLDAAVLELMERDKFKEIMAVYEKVVTFYDDTNATGIYKNFKNYAENNGTTYYKTVKTKDETGQEIERKIFDYYVPNNPDEYYFIIVDHISLLDTERNNGIQMDLRACMMKLSQYMIIARDRYGYIPVVIQQQSIETQSLEAFKANKIRPTVAGLGDSKYTGRDCSCMIGITNPYSFEKPEYLGYDITTLKDQFRVLEIVLNRNGRANGLCPVLFDGAINAFKELPLPNDPHINSVYQGIKNKQNLFFIYKQKVKRKLNGKHLFNSRKIGNR
jgi:hypothetical protein